MVYDPRKFPELRKEPSGGVAAPPAPPKPPREKHKKTDPHFRGLRRSALVTVLLAPLAYAGAWYWMKSQEPVAPIPETARARLSQDDLSRWMTTMDLLATRKRAGTFPGTGPTLREFIASPAAHSKAVDDAVTGAQWTTPRFLAACASIQTSLDLVRAEAQGRMMFAGPQDKEARKVVEERLAEVEERLRQVQ